MTSQEIKDLRQRLGWTLREMGDVLGVSHMAISKWERGERTPGPYKRAALERLRERLNEAEAQQQRERFERMVKAAATGVGVGLLLHFLFRDDDE